MNVLAICAGIGGLELGLKLAESSSRTVCYIEREAYPAAILVARMEDETLDKAPIWDDVTTFDGKPWRGKVDCITGGYPCQPFSSAGRQLGTADPRHLWPHIARIVREVQPEWCFFENVANHVNIGLREVRCDLQQMGYRVEAGIFAASETGAPHLRKRVFILAHIESPGLIRAQQQENNRCGEPGRGATDIDSEGGGVLVNSDRSGLEGPVQPLDECANQRPAWPPGPADTDSWMRVLEVFPETEPAVCRMAYGVPDRVDRLRALGNAVVPKQAALAYAVLRARFR